MTGPQDWDAWQVAAAKGRPRCTVGLDLRTADHAGAVAVDRKGRVRAWASIRGREGSTDDDSTLLARLALEALEVRPRALRVVLGPRQAQIGILTEEPDSPAPERISEALRLDGFEPLEAPAVARAAAPRHCWLVAGAEEGRLLSLAQELLGFCSAEPVFVIDQLLLMRGLEAGSARVESNAALTGLTIVAQPRDDEPYLRAIPAPLADDTAAGELRRLLPRLDGRVRLLGEDREALRDDVDTGAPEIHLEPLPDHAPQPLPAALELAFAVAEQDEDDLPMFEAPEIDDRYHHFNYARWATATGVAFVVLGIVILVLGTAAWWISRGASLEAGAARAGLESQLEQIEQAAELAKEVEALRDELAGQTVGWPRLAGTLAHLARQRPPRIGWERLSVIDSKLELEVTASGPAPDVELDRLRWLIRTSPGIVNVAWQEPRIEDQALGVRQVFQATLRDNPFDEEVPGEDEKDGESAESGEDGKETTPP